MSSSVPAKIAYNGTIRTLSVSSETKWAILEANIRQIHGISATAPFSVTYLDSDGDRISLDTDIELHDLVAQVRQSGKSIRFEVVARDPDTSSADFVLVKETAPAAVEPAAKAEVLPAPVDVKKAAVDVNTPFETPFHAAAAPTPTPAP
ncbi:hypothetical protein HK101_002641, partial [Irineochytrium annulatum]